MKTIVLFLSLFCLSAISAIAQVTITRNEFYSPGDVINMIPADPTGTSAGAAGANVTWDFSTLAGSGGMQTTVVENNTSGTFLTANLMITMPNGRRYYVKENNTDSYLQGITNGTPGGDTVYHDNYRISARPISYMTSTTDTFRTDVPSQNLTGTGYINSMVDGYGTLITPRGTYNDVLRVRKLQSETDTIGLVSTTTVTISYLWFDSVHSAPLLRIDSVIGVIGAGNIIMYQAPSTNVNTVALIKGNFRGSVSDDRFMLFGDFTRGSVYRVIAYDMIGRMIANKEFVANSGTINIDADMPLAQGMYIVNIIQRDGNGKHSIKIIK